MTRRTPCPAVAALALTLAGCLEVATGPSVDTPDAGIWSVDGIDAGPSRPPYAAPIELPDCGALSWNAAAGAGQGGGAVTAGDGGLGPLVGSDAGTSAEVAASRPGPGGVVITEVMSDPSLLGDTEGEWIELHNPAARTVDLQGCLFDDGGGTLRLLAEPLAIPPGGYATIARGAAPGFAPDRVMPMSLSNSSDALAISCDGVEVDRVAYGPGFPLGAGASMSLDAQALDASANDDAGAWCLAETPYALGFGTPGAPNPACAGDESDAGVPP